ncbi:MAG: hypothetical protein WB992_02980, partial [Bryobacteraceae bacterium]
MPDIPITDTLGLTADIQISDDALLAKSALSHLTFSSTPLIGELEKPVEETSIKNVAFGAKITAPSTLIADAAKLALKTGVTGELSIHRAADRSLFGDDEFSLSIPIASGQTWIGLEIDAIVDAKLSGKVDGFGVGVEAVSALALSTYTLLEDAGPHKPTLKQAIEKALESFSVACSAGAVRAQPAGTANVIDLSGSVKFSGSYSLPIDVNALASADLPFNHKIQVNPGVTLKIGGEIALTGDFIVRSYKVSQGELRLGVYKKKGTTLSASFTAGAGIETDVDGTDVIPAVLDAVLPGVDPKKAGITGDAAADLKSALKDCIDHTLSVAINVACSAALTDEAAVVYSIKLAAGNEDETDSAISSALKGDWTRLDSLSTATKLRNVLKDTKDFKQKININLLGVYNATTLEDYVRSCTILHDENGQLTITDKVKATRISTAAVPYAADAEKLRRVIAEATLATMIYGAASGATGAKLSAFSVKQTYFRYKRE